MSPSVQAPARPAMPARKWWYLTLDRREAIAFYLFMLPWIIGFLVFTAGPMLYSLWLTFNRYSVLKPPVWTGLENYRAMFFEDKLFWHSLEVTAKYTFAAVPVQVVMGYGVALLLNQRVRLVSAWRTVYYLPVVVPPAAGALLWGLLLSRDWGMINALLGRLGIEGPNWIGDPQWVLYAFLMIAAWQGCGGLILYLAALKQVPEALYDAAKMDGANAWRQFRHITLPMTSFAIYFTTITGIIATFQIFAQAFLLTEGGPVNASLFYVLHLYRTGWKYLKMGYASALAWVLFLLILVLTLLMMRMSDRWVYYEAE